MEIRKDHEDDTQLTSERELRLMIGKQILHYKISEELGRGGMGVVYKAFDSKLKRDVAIKFLPHQIAASEEERERFKIEAQAAAALNHPSIAHVYAIEEVDDDLFIVMEYVEGRELRGLPGENGQLPIDKATDYAIQIASGLQAAHEKGIIHRDIKSSNIMITDKGQVKIMDFGLAKVGGGQQLTKAFTTLGTAAYMSPEQARGEALDRRTDIWSFGIVLFEMLTGQLPFCGDYEQALLFSILTEEPGDIDSLRRGVPENLKSVMRGSLAKNRDRRYQQFAEILSVLKGQESKSRASVPTQKSQAALRAMVGGLALLIAGLSIWGITHLWKSTLDPQMSGQPNTIAVLPFSVRGSADFEYLGDGMVNLMSTKLDGAGDLRSVDPRALLGYLKRENKTAFDPETGKKIAKHFGANLFLIGGIFEVAGQLQIDGALYRTDDLKAVDEGASEGSADEIFDLVDDLAAQLLANLEGGPGARVRRIAGVTTSSLPAYKAYLDGEQAFRDGRYEPAVNAFQRAVALDSLFALAYYRLSIAAEWRGKAELSREAALKAYRHSGRLSEHDRLLLQGFLSWRNGDYAKAESQYRSITATYPNDVETWTQVAEVLFHTNPLRSKSLTDARMPYERVLSYEPKDVGSMLHLARLAAKQQRLAEVDSIIQITMALSPESDRFLEMQTLSAFAHHNDDRIAQVLELSKSASDIALVYAIWDVAVYSENFDRLADLCRMMAASWRPQEVQVLANGWLAHILVMQGKWQQATQILEATEQLDLVSSLEYRASLARLPFLQVPRDELMRLKVALDKIDVKALQPNENINIFFNVHNDTHPILINYLSSILSAQLGDRMALQRHLKILQGLERPQKTGSLADDLVHSVQAFILRLDNKNEAALAEINQIRNQIWYPQTLASAFYSEAFERFQKAEILFELGQYREAIGWYKYLAEITPGELAYLPFCQFRLGEIYEELGQPIKAVEHYDFFVNLWRECDMELRPLVDKARQRVARLSNFN